MAYFFSWNVPDIAGVVLLELTEVPIVDPSSVWSGEPWPGKTPSAYLKTDVYEYLEKCNYWRMNIVNYHRMYHRVKNTFLSLFWKRKSQLHQNWPTAWNIRKGYRTSRHEFFGFWVCVAIVIFHYTYMVNNR